MKPIEFETFTSAEASGTVAIQTSTEGIRIGTYNHGRANAFFTDPAKLDALADAIKRAAEALRASQRLTFGDLKDEEFFRFERDGSGFVRQRHGGSGWSTVVAGSSLSCGSASTSDTPVIRLTATFTEEKP